MSLLRRRLLMAAKKAESGGEIVFYVNDIAYTALDGMTWEEFVNSEYNGVVYESENGETYNQWLIRGNYVYWYDIVNLEDEMEYYLHYYDSAQIVVPVSKDKIIANKKYIAN